MVLINLENTYYLLLGDSSVVFSSPFAFQLPFIHIFPFFPFLRKGLFTYMHT